VISAAATVMHTMRSLRIKKRRVKENIPGLYIYGQIENVTVGRIASPFYYLIKT